jgi:hypothetical protein
MDIGHMNDGGIGMLPMAESIFVPCLSLVPAAFLFRLVLKRLNFFSMKQTLKNDGAFGHCCKALEKPLMCARCKTAT